MPKVQHKYIKEWIFDVYGAHQSEGNDYSNDIELLIWNGKWQWVNANEYIPYE